MTESSSLISQTSLTARSSKEDPIHNCCPIIFASSCTATTNWFMNNFSFELRQYTLHNLWHRQEITEKTDPRFIDCKKPAVFGTKSTPSLLTTLGCTKVVSLERLLSRTRLHVEGRDGIYQFISVFFCFCLLFSCSVILILSPWSHPCDGYQSVDTSQWKSARLLCNTE